MKNPSKSMDMANSEICDERECDTTSWLQHQANRIRLSAMTMTNHSGMGHTGGDLSSADILTTLYLGRILNVDPENPQLPVRDRFIMSKGHCSGAFYSTLAARGFFPKSMLKTFMDPLSKLNGHPDRNKLPGVEANTGPLGHGLPIGVGAALAAKMRGENWRTFVLTGDGEMQEGSNWEAAMTAQQYNLDNLIVIVDRNRIQQGDFTEKIIRMDPLAPKWAAFGFAVEEIDGHDHAALLDRFSRLPIESGKPTCIIANTIKGKGVSFAENKPAWHHGVPTAEQLALAARELGVEVSL
ncbi:MAG: transketolase [Acidobacteriaceae bacterium]